MPKSSSIPRGRGRGGKTSKSGIVGKAPSQRQLLHAVDNGYSVFVDPKAYISGGRDPGWGPHLDGFINRNISAIRALGAEPIITSGRDGARIEIKPGNKAGAIPLHSHVSGKVAGGIIISPRFGWNGVGRILQSTGWGSGPEFLTQPLVPGSGREVPPWVLAGPVITRLSALLNHLRPGYKERREVRTHPRGQILWPSYLSQQFSRGKWHQIPCRFTELGTDIRLRQIIRWTIERLRIDLSTTGGSDPICLFLTGLCQKLLEGVDDVIPRRPQLGEIEHFLGSDIMAAKALKEGLQAISWIVDERGLGGGRSSDGLAWAMSLDSLWERYVEGLARDEAKFTGGRVTVGRLGETTIPLPWDKSRQRSLGHLIPDIVVHRADGVEVIDAKYKSHFADLDVSGWHAFTEEVKAGVRADIHQVLAYTSVFDDSFSVTATLTYPVTSQLFEELSVQQRDVVTASIPIGRKVKRLRLRAIPFTGIYQGRR
jgi:hypothetical protein